MHTKERERSRRSVLRKKGITRGKKEEKEEKDNRQPTYLQPPH
jgi:hypothetical protein